MIPKLTDLCYEIPLKEFGLTTLEMWRLKGDQIQVFKMLNAYDNSDRNILFYLRKTDELEDVKLHWLSSSEYIRTFFMLTKECK